tara:strand:- start:173 stop:502 length:330 start_codon:yes stop_codon:yes gene_type:complete
MTWEDIIKISEEEESAAYTGLGKDAPELKRHTKLSQQAGFIEDTSWDKFKQKLFGEIPWGTKKEPKVSYDDLPEDAQETVLGLVALGDSKISKRKHAKYSIFNILYTYI